jgi:hypothetical protein
VLHSMPGVRHGCMSGITCPARVSTNVRRNGECRIDIATQAVYSAPDTHEEEARHSWG